MTQTALYFVILRFSAEGRASKDAQRRLLDYPSRRALLAPQDDGECAEPTP